MRLVTPPSGFPTPCTCLCKFLLCKLVEVHAGNVQAGPVVASRRCSYARSVDMHAQDDDGGPAAARASALVTAMQTLMDIECARRTRPAAAVAAALLAARIVLAPRASPNAWLRQQAAATHSTIKASYQSALEFCSFAHRHPAVGWRGLAGGPLAGRAQTARAATT